MDIAAGLTAASQTLTILKQIRELDASIDSAVFKAKLLEVQEAANEAKSALLDAKETILTKEEEILALKRQLKVATSGDSCPICRIGSLITVSVRDHPMFGDFGDKEHSLKCDNEACGHRDTKRVKGSSTLNY